MSECCDEHDVRVGRMNPDFGNRLSVGQAHMRPRLPRICGLIHAVPLHDVSADAGFPHADEDNIGICFGDGDGAYRGALDLSIGDRIPRLPAIDRLPQSAADGAEVVLMDAGRATGGCDRSTAAQRPDVAPLQGLEESGVVAARLRARNADLPNRTDERQRRRHRGEADQGLTGIGRHETSCG